MNHWQKIYIQAACCGRKPKDERGKQELKLLGTIKNIVEVDIPLNDIDLERTETYEVTDYRCSLNEGLISVAVLGPKLVDWSNAGYTIRTTQ